MTATTASASRPDLAGRVAVVTGGGSGLGAAMAATFAAAGMAVAALDIDEERAASTATKLADEHGVATTAIRTDVADVASVEAAAEHVRATLGRCDLLCANVGVQQFGAIDRLTDADWQWVLGVNVMGTIHTVREFLPLLRGRSGWRHIAVTASSGVLIPGVRLGAYQTSKFAVMGFGETRHLESSALARPAELGASVTLPDDIDAMMASRQVGEAHVATAEHAVRNLLDDLLANQPYVLTHGDYRARYNLRRDALEAAFDRMERS
jgi:NADP-dependent 3-hydroxy acid dehydrogenase YdfG